MGGEICAEPEAVYPPCPNPEAMESSSGCEGMADTPRLN